MDMKAGAGAGTDILDRELTLGMETMHRLSDKRVGTQISENKV